MATARSVNPIGICTTQALSYHRIDFGSARHELGFTRARRQLLRDALLRVIKTPAGRLQGSRVAMSL